MRTIEVVFSYVPSRPQGIDRHGSEEGANEPSEEGALPKLIILLHLHMDAEEARSGSIRGTRSGG